MRKLKKNVPCPVCGQYIFKSELNFDICSVCGWENDGTTSPDDISGANKTLSLNQAREKWNKTHTWLFPEELEKKSKTSVCCLPKEESNENNK